VSGAMMDKILNSNSYQKYVKHVKSRLSEQKLEVVKLLAQGFEAHLSIVAGNSNSGSTTSTTSASSTLCPSGSSTTSNSNSGSSQKPAAARA